jgi:cell division protein FtsQ
MSRIDEERDIVVDVAESQEGSPGAGQAPEGSAAAPAGGTKPVLRVDEARRRTLRPWAFAGGCLVCVAIAGAGLTSSPLFHAKSIAVEGEKHLTERQVLRIAGIDQDTNVFRLDEGAVRRRLERDPWIANANVSTDLPSSVTISVLERVPVAVAITPDGRVLVAQDGTALGTAAATTALPEVRLVGEPGQPAPAFDAVAAGAGVAGGLSPTIRLQVEVVVIGTDGAITLHLTDGVTVTYGEPNGFEEKSEAIEAILAYAADQGRGLVSVDVTAPAAPAARFVGSTVTVTPPVGTTPDPASPTPSDGAQPSPSATP